MFPVQFSLGRILISCVLRDLIIIAWRPSAVDGTSFLLLLIAHSSYRQCPVYEEMWSVFVSEFVASVTNSLRIENERGNCIQYETFSTRFIAYSILVVVIRNDLRIKIFSINASGLYEKLVIGCVQFK